VALIDVLSAMISPSVKVRECLIKTIDIPHKRVFHPDQCHCKMRGLLWSLELTLAKVE
jgi:hypothetical protein